MFVVVRARALLTRDLAPSLLEPEKLGLIVRREVLRASVVLLPRLARVHAPCPAIGLRGDVELAGGGPDLLVVEVGEEPLVGGVGGVEDRSEDEAAGELIHHPLPEPPTGFELKSRVRKHVRRRSVTCQNEASRVCAPLTTVPKNRKLREFWK